MSIIEWTFYNVSPFAFALFLVFASHINLYTTYLFLLSFLVWATSLCSYIGWVTYERRWVPLMWSYLGRYLQWAWDQVLKIQRFYLAKIVIGILSSYVVAGTGYWLHNNFNSLALLEETVTFVFAIPHYLFDSRLLIEAIHKWLNKVFLNHIVDAMSQFWNHTMFIIINNPILALMYIGGVLGILITILIVTPLLVSFWHIIFQYCCDDTEASHPEIEVDIYVDRRRTVRTR